MKTALIQFRFSTGVHFGDQRLENGRSAFGADTLFSALFIEALKRDAACAEALLTAVREDRLNFSNGMPLMGERYYLPKPFMHIESKAEAGDSSVKKAYKKMTYVAMDCFDAFLKGEMPLERTRDLEALGHFNMKTQVSLQNGNDPAQKEPEPYRVKQFYFDDDNGLYALVRTAGEAERRLMAELLTSLSFVGIGGRRSSGLGKFTWREAPLPRSIARRLEADGPWHMTLSNALPEDGELTDALKGASYKLVRRGGFVASASYAKEQLRKRDLYVFAAGSCFKTRFAGQVADVSTGAGSHPVYRLAKPFWMEVSR
ncbi:type III-A CRISPR-associated RAMP protein Csm4 [Pseudoramibacter faecis]|jgi:CRISPR-associated protein Csm4|uniref:type III-A CRISPR-associated RAMP protein Csm4 n=1 Tax=Pseudoramibacter faecis TaxID=3108534 RepID=UPI002E7795DE|nr:type III-A CRISPR-associated RAMP protein Csm4 [Pseudoramibacter sp. HA2172]